MTDNLEKLRAAPADRYTGRRWVLAAALAGFASSYILSGLLRLPRPLFVTGHAILTLALWLVYARSEHFSAKTQLSRRRLAGVIGGVAFGALLGRQVLGQAGSPRAEGSELLGQLALYGLVYGAADALLLSILPVLALYGSRPAMELGTGGSRFRGASIALLGSALVTAAYHAGFQEFRGPQLVQPIIGNTVITLSYLLTGSPLAPIVSHVVMHGAAVLHGMIFTMQLPPHYG
jgi:hypothetical protein